MVIYEDLHGNSGIESYDIGESRIAVTFKDGWSYLYDAMRPGSAHVAKMIELAQQGYGLNTYISQFIKKNYAKKYRR